MKPPTPLRVIYELALYTIALVTLGWGAVLLMVLVSLEFDDEEERSRSRYW